jgi:beta-N-acetylhexosaminidase
MIRALRLQLEANMNKRAAKLFSFSMLLSLIVQAFTPAGVSAYQTATPESRAATLLPQLTPEERVGQLFLVTFDGADVGGESQIQNLIENYHVGGVVLSAGNDNFTGGVDTVQATWQMIQDMQRAEWLGSQRRLEGVDGVEFSPAFIPLFVGIDQSGGGYPTDELIRGLSPLPSQLALGATWNPDIVFQAGEVLGDELTALGFNLLVGPSLDVAETPNPDEAGDLGSETFGGDPYWVGVLGQAFVAGLHSGSDDGLFVVAKHFPGHTGSNRPLDDEIPTVRKSLEQLSQIELAPFFAVTGRAASADAQVDGLLLSHIRYQGFQGNIRITTRPLSFDPDALAAVLALPEIAVWRGTHGLIISDALGARAVRRFYDPTENIFNSRLVARDAFLAGNDMLYLGDFAPGTGGDNYTSTLQTLEFFAQKYREDVAFATRVDEALFRILVNKFRLYDTFTLDTVLATENRLFRVGDTQQVGFEVARQAATLFTPAQSDLDVVLNSPPSLNERIVIITDTLSAAQCAECDLQFFPRQEEFSQAVLRLYGPEASGVVVQQNLLAFNYADLIALLDGAEAGLQLQSEIRRAEWVVFLAQDISTGRPNSNALNRFLAERPDLLQGKRAIVFALDAPYFLDATDISKLTAYYGLYSSQPQFIEIAARLLFKEVRPSGASPVSIAGIGYDVIQATSPNPNQAIAIGLDPSGALTAPEVSGRPLSLGQGATISLITSTILDNNGNIVPDNTTIDFILTSNNDGVISTREVTATTRNGIAQVSFSADSGGLLEVQAAADSGGASSNVLQFDVAGTGANSPFVVVTATNESGTFPPLAGNNGGSNSSGSIVIQPNVSGAGHWLLSLLLSMFVGLFAFQAFASQGDVRWGVRGALAAVIGGQVISAYISLNLPGVDYLLSGSLIWGVVLSTLIGAVAGWVLSHVWRMYR